VVQTLVLEKKFKKKHTKPGGGEEVNLLRLGKLQAQRVIKRRGVKVGIRTIKPHIKTRKGQENKRKKELKEGWRVVLKGTKRGERRRPR